MPGNPPKSEHVDLLREARESLGAGIVEVQPADAAGGARLAEEGVDLGCGYAKYTDVILDYVKALKQLHCPPGKRYLAGVTVLGPLEFDEALREMDSRPGQCAEFAAAHRRLYGEQQRYGHALGYIVTIHVADVPESGAEAVKLVPVDPAAAWWR